MVISHFLSNKQFTQSWLNIFGIASTKTHRYFVANTANGYILNWPDLSVNGCQHTRTDASSLLMFHDSPLFNTYCKFLRLIQTPKYIPFHISMSCQTFTTRQQTDTAEEWKQRFSDDLLSVKGERQRTFTKYFD